MYAIEGECPSPDSNSTFWWGFQNALRKQNKQIGLNQTYKILYSKGNYKKMKIYANDATSKNLISKIYKQITQVKKQKKPTQLKKGQKT